jgi:hypothetical protein
MTGVKVFTIFFTMIDLRRKNLENKKILSLRRVLRWLNTVFKKMENSRFRYAFLNNYYLLINKKYLTYIKQRLKSLNFCTIVTQLPLLWQQLRFKMADILALK